MLHKNDCTFKCWEDGCEKVFLPELLCIDLPRLVLAKIDNNTVNHTSSLEQGQKQKQMLNNLPLEFEVENILVFYRVWAIESPWDKDEGDVWSKVLQVGAWVESRQIGSAETGGIVDY